MDLFITCISDALPPLLIYAFFPLFPILFPYHLDRPRTIPCPRRVNTGSWKQKRSNRQIMYYYSHPPLPIFSPPPPLSFYSILTSFRPPLSPSILSICVWPSYLSSPLSFFRVNRPYYLWVESAGRHLFFFLSFFLFSFFFPVVSSLSFLSFIFLFSSLLSFFLSPLFFRPGVNGMYINNNNTL